MWHFSISGWYESHEKRKAGLEIGRLKSEFFSLESVMYRNGECGMYGFHPHSLEGREDYELMNAMLGRVNELCALHGLPNPIEAEYARRKQAFDAGDRSTGPLSYRHHRLASWF